ncbi:MAG: zinc-dependent metalloprotease [Deltaproteobacteria bacterium]|nr:zinc-dependent metalloprotease [Deltaproteobacteria bacterium]
MRSKWTLRMGLGAGLAVAALGCAQERAPVVRVQPNALEKSFFVGPDLAKYTDDPVFYWRNSVVNATANQSELGVGSYSGTDKIRWEITEGLLIARKAYQIATHQDDKGLANGPPNGTVVAAYKIQSHFDIIRDYNPATGEELNVVVENTTDKPWYERQYMRVDWSTNTVVSPEWGEMFIGKIFGDLNLTPLTYYVTDPAADDAPHFEPDKGYFDITNKYFVEPTNTQIWGMSIPTCALIGLYTDSMTNNCDAQEAYVRSAFLRVDPNEDFEPTENTRAPNDVVANFGGAGDSFMPGLGGGKVQCWDPQYAYTDACYHTYLIKHNFWVRSHQQVECTSDEDKDNDGTADACANSVTGYNGSTGSQCDIAKKLCTLPVRDRIVKTNGYWLNIETPLELQDTMVDGARGDSGPLEDVIQTWNLSIRVSLAFAREIECRRTGGTRAECHAKYFVVGEDGKDVQVIYPFGAWLVPQSTDTVDALTTCHVPTRAYDNHEVCGETGAMARFGDFRKNWIFYWPWDSNAPWGGIANLGEDPTTGQTHGATATVMGRSATRAAAIYRDFIQVAMGDLTVDDLLTGVPQAMYAKTLSNGYAPAKYTKEDLARAVSDVDAAHAQAMTPTKLGSLSLKDRVRAVMQAEKVSTDSVELQSAAQLKWEALASKMRGTTYEADMVDSHWAMNVAGTLPNAAVTDDVMERVSPLRGLDNGRTALWRQQISMKLANKGVCYGENDIPRVGSVNFQALGFYYKKKFGDLDAKARGEAIYHDLWKQMAAGIAIHEVGHCLGLRHNFASSYDSPNYMPQYWQLRTGETSTASTVACDPNTPRDPASEDTCMGPRYLDPETPDEAGMAGEGRPGVTYFGNSSVMEYEMDYLSPGFGQYDQMAMNAIYGGVLETFDDAAHGGFDPPDQIQFVARMQSQLSDEDMMLREMPPAFGPGNAVYPVHYTRAARTLQNFDSARDCRPATPDEVRKGEWRVVHGKVCGEGPRDHAAWKDFVHDPIDTELAGWTGNLSPFTHTRPDAKTGGSMVRWKYRYGETYGTAYWHTSYLDSGADPYEVTHNTMLHFKYTYPMSHFRRGNRQYYYDSVPSSVVNRYFERVRAFHWNVGSAVAQYGPDGVAILGADDDWFRPDLMAEQELFGMLQQALLAPEPGGFSKVDAVGGGVYYDVPPYGEGTAFIVGVPTGRFIGEEFDSDPTAGGSWNYLAWMKHTGFHVEKALAMRTLVDSRPELYVIARETYMDGRNVFINYRNDLPQAVDRLLGSVLAEDWTTAGVYWDPAKPMDLETGEIQPEFMSLMDAVPTRPSDAKTIAGNLGYRQQVAGVIFAALFSRLNSDMELVNKTRIWVDGVDGAVSLTTFPESDQIRFTNPESGFTYIARKYGSEVVAGKTVDKGIASRMIQRANGLLMLAYVTDNKLNAFGAPTMILNSNGQPQVKSSEAVGALRQYVGLIDAVRQVGHDMGYGPLEGTSGPGDL